MLTAVLTAVCTCGLEMDMVPVKREKKKLPLPPQKKIVAGKVQKNPHFT